MKTIYYTIDLFHKSQNAPVPYPTMLHSEQKCAHLFSEWNIVGYGTGAFRDSWNCSFARFVSGRLDGQTGRKVGNDKDHGIAKQHGMHCKLPNPINLKSNERHGVQNNRQVDCLFNSVFRLTANWTSKLHIIDALWSKCFVNQWIPLAKEQ